jgi:hypothetical protein
MKTTVHFSFHQPHLKPPMICSNKGYHQTTDIMKTTVLFFLFISLAVWQAKAQFLGGFFSQQAIKKKLMLEQIAGLEIYLQGIKGGYMITENGLNVAHERKSGAFGFHAAYFNSLEQVNPLVQSDPKGKSIYDMHQQLIRVFDTELAWQQKEKLLNGKELAYIQKVYVNLLMESRKDLDELPAVLTPGKLALTDEQRLDRLERIYGNMKDKYAFAGYFTEKCRKLAAARLKAKQENKQLKKLYGIN